MNLGQIITADCANGPGMRVTIFVSGCTNHCKGCFQPETWDFAYGRPYDPAMEQWILDELSKPYYQGLTILGGEPFEPKNQAALLPLIRRVRTELPDRDIWMYTGNDYADLLEGGRRYTADTDGILDNIDVLVDGRFELELRNLALGFKGSENQRIIDMPATREKKEVVISSYDIKKGL